MAGLGALVRHSVHENVADVNEKCKMAVTPAERVRGA